MLDSPAQESPPVDRYDEQRKSYAAVARKALGPCLGFADPRVPPIILVTAGGEGRPFVLSVPRPLDASASLGVVSGESEQFTFFDGRGLRRVLLAILGRVRVALDEVRLLGEAHLAKVKTTTADVATQAAAIEAWDGY